MPLANRVSRASLSCHVARPAAALLLLLTFACGPPDGGAALGDRVARFDSAGVEVVESRRPAWTVGQAWRIDPAPALQIGRFEGPEEELLHGVVAVRGAGEGILVAEETELRLYDAGGNLTGRFGGPGQGPGEMQRLHSALVCGERLLATDLVQSRLTVFEADAAPRLLALPPPEGMGQLRAVTLHACAGEAVLGATAGARPPSATPPVVQRQDELIIRLDEADGRWDTLLVVAGMETFRGLSVPFGRRTLFALTDNALHVLDTGRPELRVLGLDGSVRRVVRLAAEAREVTRGDVERIRELYLAGLPPGIVAEITPRLDAVPIPTTMPYFSALQVAPDGTVWLQEYQPFRDEEVRRWTVVDAGGEWLGDVELPEGLTVHEVRANEVLGVWRDARDVEHVRLHRIIR